MALWAFWVLWPGSAGQDRLKPVAFISFNVEDESHPGSGCKWLRLDTPYIAKLQGLYVERFINVHKFATPRDAKVAQVRWHNLFRLSSLIVAPLHVRLKVVPETPGISQ